MIFGTNQTNYGNENEQSRFTVVRHRLQTDNTADFFFPTGRHKVCFFFSETVLIWFIDAPIFLGNKYNFFLEPINMICTQKFQFIQISLDIGYYFQNILILQTPILFCSLLFILVLSNCTIFGKINFTFTENSTICGVFVILDNIAYS